MTDEGKMPGRRVNEVVETVMMGAATDFTYGGGYIIGPEDFPGGKIPAWLLGGCQTDQDRAERDQLLKDIKDGTKGRKVEAKPSA